MSAPDRNRLGVPYDPQARAAYVGRATCETCGARFHRLPPIRGPRHVCPDCT